AAGSPGAAASGGASGAPAASASPGASASPAASAVPSGPGTAVSLASVGRLGPILVDAQGRTLYLYGADTSVRTTCTGECADYWPPVTTTGQPVAGQGVDDGLLGAAPLGNGLFQVLYKGHPLYRCSTDQVSGDTSGQETEDFAGTWYTVNALGDAVQGG
ncbi:hypothetical protein, partial [Kitasatospora paracochleata]|uniref:COG4315 family predicted lipoprotein n=1 Tax=Kitasatospora paracochleata TaxID=58354 RepID=UPI0031D88876